VLLPLRPGGVALVAAARDGRDGDEVPVALATPAAVRAGRAPPVAAVRPREKMLPGLAALVPSSVAADEDDAVRADAERLARASRAASFCDCLRFFDGFRSAIGRNATGGPP